MHVRPMYAFVLLALAVPAAANDPAVDADAFNAAWYAFTDARQSGDSAAQRELAKRVLDLGSNLLGPEDERVPALMANYAIVLEEQKEFELAHDTLEQALGLATAIHGENSEPLIPYLEKLARVSGTLQNGGQLRGYQHRALTISGQRFGKESIAHGDLLYRSGANYVRFGDADDGRSLLRDASEIFSGNPEAGARRVALTDFWLGKAEMSLHHRASATDYLLQALTAWPRSRNR